jgi:YD repeat-containing protein
MDSAPGINMAKALRKITAQKLVYDDYDRIVRAEDDHGHWARYIYNASGFLTDVVHSDDLGGQCKTGHAGSLQNRPCEMARDVILFIPLSPDQASLF